MFIPGCNSSTPCALSASVRSSLTLRSAPGSKVTKCSGHPGHGRPGRWRSVFSPSSRIPPSSRKNTLRRRDRLPGLSLNRPSFEAVLSRAVPARGREAVCYPQCQSLPLLQGAQGLPSTTLQRARHPHAPDRLPPQRSTAFRDLWHWETLSRVPAPATSRKRTAAPASPTRLRDSQHHRPTKGTTPQP